MERDLTDQRPLRREYSEDFKAEVLAQTRQTDASVSGVALSHGLHPNMVQRRRREDRQRQAAAAQQNIEPAFAPLRLAPVCDPLPEATEAPTPAVETISMELTRAGATLTVHWPVSAIDTALALVVSNRQSPGLQPSTLGGAHALCR